MSATPAQVTEAHKALADLCHDHAYSHYIGVSEDEQEARQVNAIAQLIADSEAQVTADAEKAIKVLADKIGVVTAERDQLRAERDELKQKLCNRPAVKECAELRADLATERARLDWVLKTLTPKEGSGVMVFGLHDRNTIDSAMKETT